MNLPRFGAPTTTDAALQWRHTATDDGHTLSIVMDNAGVASRGADTDARPDTLRTGFRVPVQGQGWARVAFRGALLRAGDTGLAHVQLRVNGRLLRGSLRDNESFAVEGFVPLRNNEGLRLDALLLAQRDLADAGAETQVWLDTIDIEAVNPKRR